VGVVRNAVGSLPRAAAPTGVMRAREFSRDLQPAMARAPQAFVAIRRKVSSSARPADDNAPATGLAGALRDPKDHSLTASLNGSALRQPAVCVVTAERPSSINPCITA